jgi:hypothetical protein
MVFGKAHQTKTKTVAEMRKRRKKFPYSRLPGHFIALYPQENTFPDINTLSDFHKVIFIC